MKALLVIPFIFIIISQISAQDLYNPDLIKKLKVKSQKIIHSGSNTDTTELKYDAEGRIIFKTTKECTDSTFYKKRGIVKKNYSNTGVLKSTETTTLDKDGNIIRFERDQLLPLVYYNGYESVFKKGKMISTKSFHDSKTFISWDKSMEIKSDSILYYDDDTEYHYLLNHNEVLWFKEEGSNKELGYLAFDDEGRVIASGNYVHNKPNQVSIFVRRYNSDLKTYTEEIHTEYFFENGLYKQTDSGDLITNHYYEFY
jgi:hypothetical protein